VGRLYLRVGCRPENSNVSGLTAHDQAIGLVTRSKLRTAIRRVRSEVLLVLLLNGREEALHRMSRVGPYLRLAAPKVERTSSDLHAVGVGRLELRANLQLHLVYGEEPDQPVLRKRTGVPMNSRYPRVAGMLAAILLGAVACVAAPPAAPETQSPTGTSSTPAASATRTWPSQPLLSFTPLPVLSPDEF
jgi:hypothetical protein